MKQLSTLDRVIAGAAAVAFVTLFLPWYGVSVGQLDVSGGGGVTGSVGAILLTAAGVVLVARKAGGSLRAGSHAAPSLLVAGLAATGLLLVIIRWLTLPRYDSSGPGLSYSVGPRYGLYVALLAGIVETAAAVMVQRSATGQAPWERGKPEPEAPSAPEE